MRCLECLSNAQRVVTYIILEYAGRGWVETHKLAKKANIPTRSLGHYIRMLRADGYRIEHRKTVAKKGKAWIAVYSWRIRKT